MARHMRNGRDYSRPGPKVDYELRKDSNNAARSGEVYDKIEEVQSQIVPTASIESGETASKAYSVDDFLVKDGSLYKVIKAITEGDTLTVGENIDSTTVVSELSSINLTDMNTVYSEPPFSSPTTISKTGLYLVYANGTACGSDAHQSTHIKVNNVVKSYSQSYWGAATALWIGTLSEGDSVKVDCSNGRKQNFGIIKLK